MTEHSDERVPAPAEDTLRTIFTQLAAPNAPGIVLEPEEAIVFLAMSASDYWRTPCENQHCEVCYGFVTMWKSVYSALVAHDRLTLENLLEAYDTRAPAFPQSLR